MIKERSGSSLDKKGGHTSRFTLRGGGGSTILGELMTLGHSQQFDYHAPGRGGIFVEGEGGRYFQTNANK